LYKKHFSTKLIITFSINENILEYSQSLESNSIGYGIGSLMTSIKNVETKQEVNPWYQFSLSYGYISVHMFYNKFSDVGLGSDWTANTRYIYLGSENNDFFDKMSDFLYLKEKKWLTVEEYYYLNQLSDGNIDFSC
jgi:hypothetical protein